MKPFLLLLLFTTTGVMLFGQEDLKNRLLDYDFQRVKITTSAKSLIIDYVKKDRFDSINILIRFCDSINAPDNSWLAARDRLILKALEGDAAFLGDRNTYIDRFGMVDTVPKGNTFRNYLRYPMRFGAGEDMPYSNPGYKNQEENLSYFLVLLFKQRIEKIKQALSQYPDVYSFIDMMFTVREYYYGDDRVLQDKVHRFLTMYPKSSLYDLVLYNFSQYRNENRTGGSLGLTMSYDMYPWKTNKVISDHPQIGLVLNFYKDRFLFHGSTKVWTTKTNSALIYGADTLKKGSKVNTPKLRLALGYLAFRRSLFYFSPYTGYEWFFPEKTNSDKGKSKNFGVPNSHGPILGFHIEKLNQESFGSLWMLNAGFAFVKTRNIRSDLGNNYFFVDLGWAFGGCERERYFPTKAQLARMR